jgi:hypothetical protein
MLMVNRYLIALFAFASGAYKGTGGAADIALFARVGLSATAVAVFGAIQALAGAALLTRARRPAAVVVAACNAFASYALFVGGVQPFGVISLVFVGMALLECRAGEPLRTPVSSVGPNA